MSTLLKRAHHGLLIIVTGLLCLSLFSPMIAMASASLAAGDQAVISNPNGSGANLRNDITLDDSSLIMELAQGTAVTIADGPIVADTGTWYWVNTNDGSASGFVEASLLAAVTAEEPASEDAEADVPTEPATEDEGPATLPWQEPIDFGFVVDDNNIVAEAGGLACRVEASVDAEIITRIPLTATLEVIDTRIWDGEQSFVQINCGDVSGFVNGTYVVLQSEQASEPIPEETEVVPEEPVEGDVPAEEPVAPETPETEVPTDVETEEPSEEEPAPADETETPDATETETPVEDEVTDEPAETEVPAEDAVTEEPADEATETEDEASEESTPTEEVVETETPADEAIEEPADEVATEEPADEATEEPADEATEEPVTEEPVETEVVETETPDETEPVESETPAETETPDETEPVEAETPAETEVPAEDETEPAEEAAEETTPAEEATEDAEEADEATDEATEEATEETTPAPTVPATTPETPASTVPTADVSKSIGSAEVTGTNGDGIRCRVAPGTTSPTITVLPEGTKVYVLAEPVDGWMKISCGGYEGYGDVNYLWAGGASDEELPKKAGASIVVSGTGNGLNCRTGAGLGSPVITVLSDGTVLKTRAAAKNGWIAVVCGGQNGFVATEFVENVSGSTSSPAKSSTTNGSGTATITGTNGDGLRCRSGAGTSYSIITVLGDGTRVPVRGGSQGSWTPVTCGGKAGWVHNDYIKVSSSGSGNAGSGNTSGGGASSGSVIVTGTGGGGLNCRTQATTGSGVITVLREGSSVPVRGKASNGWQPVTCGGKNGFVSTDYVKAGSSSTPTNPAPKPSNPDSGSKVTGSGTVSGTNGDGVRCRSGAGTNHSTITVLAEGTKVSTRGKASGGWVPVVCGGTNGWVHGDYLKLSSTNTPAPKPNNPAPAPSGLAKGDHAKTTANLNLRYEASLGSGVATAAPAGTVVEITGGASNGFYPVDWDGLRGYMHGDYLTKTNEALSQRGGSGSAPQQPAPGGSNPGTATGNAIVDYAMRYVGYPYVWATAGPSSFDCSGFTYWVIKNVVGQDIGRGLWTQISSGKAVSRDNLQPGDLVFFQNTYTAGLSHSGIYIGNGQFVHAENESTGVRVSDLNSEYYASRWYGARRIG